MPEVARQMIRGAGLGHLPTTMFNHIDTPLICAFVERWQPDTNTFHMPFGEMTILLHDVWQILCIPVEGQLVSADTDSYQLRGTCMEVLGVMREELQRDYWSGGGVSTDGIVDLCRGEEVPAHTQAVGWMWMMLGVTLFVDKSGNRVRPSLLQEMTYGLDGMQAYSWGSATLAYLYRHLGMASRGDCQGLAGCLTLLQAWIYEYFPCFRPVREHQTIDPQTPRARMWTVRSEVRSDERLDTLRQCLDQLTASEVVWLPYGPAPAADVPRTTYSGWLRYRDILETYIPLQVLRQFEYVQVIPPRAPQPARAIRPWASRLYRVENPPSSADNDWYPFPYSSNVVLALYEVTSGDHSECDSKYMDWYTRYLHIRLLPDDQAPPAMPPPRSNPDYWMGRVTTWGRGVLRSLCDVDEAEASRHETGLEDILREWD